MSAPVSGSPHTSADIPHVVGPPPLIYLLPLLTSLGVARWQRRPFLPEPWPQVLGPVLCLGGLLLLAAALRGFRAARTNPKPWKPTTALVFSGPYRFTRNPMYLGFTLIYIGVTCWANTMWPWLGLLVVLPVMEWGVIRREERYLARTFGEPYEAYRQRVRRWL